MPRFRNFDPYKKDKERRLHERGQETKKVQESFRHHNPSPQERVFAALARCKKRLVSLAPVK